MISDLKGNKTKQNIIILLRGKSMKYKVKQIGMWMLIAFFFLLTVSTFSNGYILGGMLFALLTMFISPLRGMIFERFHWPNLKAVTMMLIAFMLLVGGFVSLAANVDTSVNTINQLNDQVKEISLEKKSLNLTIDDLNDTISSFEEQIQQKKTEYDTSLSQKDSLIKEKEEQISQLEEQIGQLEEQLEAQANHQNKIDSLTNENNSLKDEISQLEQQVSSAKTTKAPVEDSKPSVASTTTIENEDNDETTVYITNTGEKYHLAGCRYLKSSKISISKSEAVKQGYAACKVCKP